MRKWKGEPLRKLVWMIITHWFADWSQEKYMPKKRFRLCEGCLIDWREYWHPTPWPEKEANDG